MAAAWPSAPKPVALQGVERKRLVRRAQLLAWASLAWMTAEGVIALVAGVLAGSIALIGFGIDSAIEGLASVIIIWRFWGARAMSERAERRAQNSGSRSNEWPSSSTPARRWARAHRTCSVRICPWLFWRDWR